MGNIINLKKMMSAAMFAAGLLVSMNSASAQQDEHLFWPPFNAQQTALIKQGEVPSGKL